jgi:AcrR family transcriptional regulator
MAEKESIREPGTREYILSVASRLFSERGFASVSIRDICEEAGVTPPTIYYYFDNKDKLFENVIKRSLSLKDFWGTLDKSVNQQDDPLMKLQAFIEHYLRAFPRGFFNPGMFLQTTTQIYSKSTERVMDESREINDLAGEIISLGIETGQFRVVDVSQATQYLMTSLLAYVLVEVHYHQTQRLVESAEFIADMFLNGLINRGISQ